MLRLAMIAIVALSSFACSKKEPAGQAPPASTTGGANLTVGAYCTAFCTKLCGTCGDAACPTTCNTRCDFGRSPDSLLDGKDPKVALARTQQNLDECLATITKDACPGIMAGNVPPACFTIQH